MSLRHPLGHRARTPPPTLLFLSSLVKEPMPPNRKTHKTTVQPQPPLRAAKSRLASNRKARCRTPPPMTPIYPNQTKPVKPSSEVFPKNRAVFLRLSQEKTKTSRLQKQSCFCSRTGSGRRNLPAIVRIAARGAPKPPGIPQTARLMTQCMRASTMPQAQTQPCLASASQPRIGHRHVWKERLSLELTTGRRSYKRFALQHKRIVRPFADQAAAIDL